MPRQNLNVDGKIGGRKCKVRKRGCSSSSSSSLVQNYRLKRAFLVGKRVGSTTPVPKWKMMNLESPSMENDKVFGGEKAKESSVSARKLAATLWEIDGLGSPRLKREDRKSEVEMVRKQRISESSRLGSTALVLSDLIPSPVYERMDNKPMMAAHRRRASSGSQKLLTADSNLGSTKSPRNFMVEVDQIQNHARSPCRHINGTKNRLKDVYNGLVTSKELLKVMSRVCRLEEQNSTCVSIFSALKFELDRACIYVGKLIQEERTKGSEVDNLLKQLEEEKMLWKIKEQDRIRREFETERKLRKQTERLNKKLGKELAETKESLLKKNTEVESEKRAREILEQVCDELARGIGEDRAEVEEVKRRSAKVCQEVEKEREMLQLADVLREERVQMKLAEARYQFEEKNEVVDKLRDELEAYLKAKKGEDQGDGSPSYDKIKELEKYLRETLPISYEHQDEKRNGIEAVNEEEDDDDNDDDDDDDDEDDDDSGDSDLHSIELNMDDLSKSFKWSDGLKIESKRNSVDKSKGRKSNSEKMGKQVTLDEFDKRGLFEFSSKPWKKDVEEDEIERYNMIKDLRDHIVSSSKIVTSQPSNDPTNGVVCEG